MCIGCRYLINMVICKIALLCVMLLNKIENTRKAHILAVLYNVDYEIIKKHLGFAKVLYIHTHTQTVNYRDDTAKKQRGRWGQCDAKTNRENMGGG